MLLDLHLDAIGLWADLTQSLPDIPEPTTADGTFEGTPNYQQISVQSLEDLMIYLKEWWTGPWPKLHYKIDYVNDEGYSVKYHISKDLLGLSETEERFEANTYLIDDPSNEAGFEEKAADLYFQTFLKFWGIELALIVADIFAVWSCAALEKSPANWPFIALTGTLWVLGFIAWLWLSVNDVCQNTNDPFERFWVITALGITGLFGFGLADFLKDLGSYLIKNGIRKVTEFFNDREGPSLSWILFKLLLSLFVFALAGIVLILTINVIM